MHYRCGPSILEQIPNMRFIFFVILLLSSTFLFAQYTIEPPSAPVDTTIFEKVEVEASVDKAAWMAHLTKELWPVIEKAAIEGIKPGSYTVRVRFLVEKDGSISYVHATNDPGKGLAKSAERVVKTGPKWKPAEHNGKMVRSYHTQPITFVFSEDEE